jgi:hypothetical protein
MMHVVVILFLHLLYLPFCYSLRVGMYPYIPDVYGNNNVYYSKRIQGDVNKMYPTMNAHVDLIPSPYDLEAVNVNLTCENGYDVMELDGLLLAKVFHNLYPWNSNMCILCAFFVLVEIYIFYLDFVKLRMTGYQQASK